MADVVSFADRKPVEQAGEPDEELVHRIEDLLAEAKAGTITWLAYAAIRSNNNVRWGHTGPSNERHTKVAATVYLQRMVEQDLVDND
jgi:hypothetical protein